MASTIKKKTRQRLWVREKSRCFWCDDLTDKEEGTIDHVIPQSMGGGHVTNNVVFSCLRCNAEKADELPISWEHFLEPIVSRKELRRCRQLIALAIVNSRYILDHFEAAYGSTI